VVQIRDTSVKKLLSIFPAFFIIMYLSKKKTMAAYYDKHLGFKAVGKLFKTSAFTIKENFKKWGLKGRTRKDYPSSVRKDIATEKYAEIVKLRFKRKYLI
jgi:hypothetical protein